MKEDKFLHLFITYTPTALRKGEKMSKFSLNTAIKYGETLRGFNDKFEAEDYFISYKDHLLNRLKAICEQIPGFLSNYTVESLKNLEKQYFDLYEENTFDKVGTTQEEFESIMSVYWGEVIVKNNEDAKYVVEEFPFSQRKYELLVNKGLCSVSIVDKFRDLYRLPHNKRRNLLFREYNRYFVR